MTRFALLALPLFALVACGPKADNAAASSAPVAVVKPPPGKQWTDVVEKTAEGYRMGNPKAPITLVEYGARLCPACKAFANEGFEPLTSKYVSTGKVNFEFRDFLIHGPAELALAILGQCGGSAPFFPILEQTYLSQDTFTTKLQTMPQAQQQALQGQPPSKMLTTLADFSGAIDFVKQRGIPEATARACLADQKSVDAIAKITTDASANGTVTQTPTLIVNGNKLDTGAWRDVEAALKNAGA